MYTWAASEKPRGPRARCSGAAGTRAAAARRRPRRDRPTKPPADFENCKLLRAIRPLMKATSIVVFCPTRAPGPDEGALARRLRGPFLLPLRCACATDRCQRKSSGHLGTQACVRARPRPRASAFGCTCVCARTCVRRRRRAWVWAWAWA